MDTIRPLLTTLLLLFIVTASYSQSIARQSVNSFGGSAVADGYRISATAGQTYITQTEKSGSLVFHPGFQQQMIAGKKQVIINGEGLNIKLFPNPASTEFRIMPSQVIGEAIITVLDMNGKVVSETIHSQFRETSIDTSGWPAGLYAIRLADQQAHETFSARILIIR
ncbi:MAG: T9SS type A sorting domain-containing protein [Bacteroidales bacterium]|nr:T9SS type A sorting domain-containing protein [Bacteroidales bacterium]MDT8433018.1 T9SS type A sorting domain-containing protein [Bacteroidales bacterium]